MAIIHQVQGVKFTLNPFLFQRNGTMETEIEGVSTEGERKDINTLDFTFPVHSFTG